MVLKGLLSIATEYHRYCRGFGSLLYLMQWGMRQLFRAEKVQLFVVQNDQMFRLQNAGDDACHRPGPQPKENADNNADNNAADNAAANNQVRSLQEPEGAFIDFPQTGVIRTPFKMDAGLAGLVAMRKSSVHVHFLPKKDGSGEMEVRNFKTIRNF